MNGFSYQIGLNITGESALSRAIGSLDKLDALIERTGGSVDKLDNKIDKIGKVGHASFGKIGDAINSVLARLALFEVGRRIVTLTSEMEQNQVAFETMLGSANQADILLKKLNKFADVTPFSNKEVIESGRNLLAFGFAADSIESTLRKIGDVASGVNAPLGEMSAIFGKMKTKGVVQTEELDLLTSRGIPIIAELAKILGVSDRQVYKLASDSKIGFAEVVMAFDNMTGAGGQFQNLMEKQSQTLGGKWSTFVGTLETVAIKIGTELLPVLIPMVDGFVQMAVWTGNNIPLIMTIFDWVGLFAVALGGLWVAQKGYALMQGILAVKTAIMTVATMLYTWWTNAQTVATEGAAAAQTRLNASFWENPLAIFIGLVLGAVAAVMYLWNRFEGFRAFLGGVWGTFKGIAMILGDLISLAKGFGEVLIGTMTWDPTMIAKGIKDGANAVENLWNTPDRMMKSISDGVQGAAGSSFRFDPLGGLMPKMPGSDALANAFGNQNAPTKPGGGNGGGKNNLAAGIKGVNEGGARNVTINLGALNQGGITIHTTNLKEGADEVYNRMVRLLQQALNTGNQVQGR